MFLFYSCYIGCIICISRNKVVSLCVLFWILFWFHFVLISLLTCMNIRSINVWVQVTRHEEAFRSRTLTDEQKTMHLYMHSGGAKSSQSTTSEARAYQVVSILSPVFTLLFCSVHLHCMIALFCMPLGTVSFKHGGMV